MSENIEPDDNMSQWENILADADIKSVPINYLKSIVIKMMDGTEEIFDVTDLKNQNLKTSEIEELIEAFVDQYDDEIDTLDFVLNVETIASEVGGKTKRLLGD